MYYFKYRELQSIFTINDHISDNSIQVNIKFTFTVYEYILLSNLTYIIYKYNIYIYIYIMFLYIYIYTYKLCVFCLLEHCFNTCTRWSRCFHIHMIFSSQFYLIIVTSRSSLQTLSKLSKKKPAQFSKNLFCYSW